MIEKHCWKLNGDDIKIRSKSQWQLTAETSACTLKQSTFTNVKYIIMKKCQVQIVITLLIFYDKFLVFKGQW